MGTCELCKHVVSLVLPCCGCEKQICEACGTTMSEDPFFGGTGKTTCCPTCEPVVLKYAGEARDKRRQHYLELEAIKAACMKELGA